MHKNSSAWSVAISGLIINLCFGVFNAWSVFSKALQDDELAVTAASMTYILAIAVFALVMVPAGIMLDKFGPRIVLTISGILMGLGMIIAGIFLNLIGLIIGFGIIAGAAMGFGYAAPTPTATRWFKPHMRGTKIGRAHV